MEPFISMDSLVVCCTLCHGHIEKVVWQTVELADTFAEAPGLERCLSRGRQTDREVNR